MASSKYAQHELHEILNEVADIGYAVIRISKMFRLLGKGNRAAGTWRALLDEWEESREGNERSKLNISEIPGDYILLTTVASVRATERAQEE